MLIVNKVHLFICMHIVNLFYSSRRYINVISNLIYKDEIHSTDKGVPTGALS